MFKIRFRKWGLQKNIKKNKTQTDATGKGSEIWKDNNQMDQSVAWRLKKDQVPVQLPASNESTSRPEGSGYIRTATPPPLRLRDPEMLRKVEIALVSFRHWVDGNSQNTDWAPRRVNLSAGLECFGPFLEGLRDVSQNVDSQVSFAKLELAFSKIRSLNISHPIIFTRLTVALMQFEGYPDSPICRTLCHSLFNYCRRLFTLTCPFEHPLTHIWPLFGELIERSDNNEQVQAVFIRSVTELALQCTVSSRYQVKELVSSVTGLLLDRSTPERAQENNDGASSCSAASSSSSAVKGSGDIKSLRNLHILAWLQWKSLDFRGSVKTLEEARRRAGDSDHR